MVKAQVHIAHQEVCVRRHRDVIMEQSIGIICVRFTLWNDLKKHPKTVCMAHISDEDYKENKCFSCIIENIQYYVIDAQKYRSIQITKKNNDI